MKGVVKINGKEYLRVYNEGWGCGGCAFISDRNDDNIGCPKSLRYKEGLRCSSDYKEHVIFEEIKPKRKIYCGVTDMDGNPVALTEEQEKRFVESMSNGGKNDVIFCKTNAIPKMVQATAAIMTLNKK